MKFHYNCQGHEVFCTNDLFEAFHELVCDKIKFKNFECNIMVCLESTHGKRNKVVIDVLTIDDQFNVHTSPGSASFNLRDIVSSNNIHALPYLDNSQNTFIKSAIFKLLSNHTVTTQSSNIRSLNTQPLNTQPLNTQPLNTQPLNTQPLNTQPQNNIKKQVTINEITNEIPTVSPNTPIDELLSMLDSRPVIKKIPVKKSKKSKKSCKWKHNFQESDESDTDTSSNASNSDESSGSSNIFDITSISSIDNSEHDSDISSIKSDDDEDTVDLKKSIMKLSQVKTNIDNQIASVNDTIKNEKENLSNYHCEVSEKEFNIKRAEEQLREEYNRFISERDFTYDEIYKKFFIRRKIKGFECVPPLFMVKFPIFLFLDGRDVNGKQVREKILGTKNDFRLYKMFSDALLDDEFEHPEDDIEEKLLDDFLNSYPNIPIQTEQKVMQYLNDETHKHKRIFTEDETSQHSAESDKSDDE